MQNKTTHYLLHVDGKNSSLLLGQWKYFTKCKFANDCTIVLFIYCFDKFNLQDM